MPPIHPYEAARAAVVIQGCVHHARLPCILPRGTRTIPEAAPWIGWTTPLNELGLTFPFEFHLARTPISLQGSSRSRESWKNDIKHAARKRVQETDDFVILDSRPVALTIYYFPEAPMAGDVDNIVKPIMDALQGLTYLDDRDVERVVVQKFEPDVIRQFTNPSDQLAAALDVQAPIVYIRVDDDLSWRGL